MSSTTDLAAAHTTSAKRKRKFTLFSDHNWSLLREVHARSCYWLCCCTLLCCLLLCSSSLVIYLLMCNRMHSAAAYTHSHFAYSTGETIITSANGKWIFCKEKYSSVLKILTKSHSQEHTKHMFGMVQRAFLVPCRSDCDRGSECLDFQCHEPHLAHWDLHLCSGPGRRHRRHRCYCLGKPLSTSLLCLPLGCVYLFALSTSLLCLPLYCVTFLTSSLGDAITPVLTCNGLSHAQDSTALANICVPLSVSTQSGIW